MVARKVYQKAADLHFHAGKVLSPWLMYGLNLSDSRKAMLKGPCTQETFLPLTLQLWLSYIRLYIYNVMIYIVLRLLLLGAFMFCLWRMSRESFQCIY